MDHGGEAARSTELGMAGAVQGSEPNIGTGTFDGHLGAAAAAAARRFSFDAFEPSAAAYQYHDSAEFARHVRSEVLVAAGFHFHRQPGPGVAYPNIGEFWRQPGPVGLVLVGPRLPDGVVPVLDDDGYSALQPRPGTGRGVVYNRDYARQPGPGSGHHVLPDGAGVVYNNYMWQPSPAAGHGDVFVGVLPDDVDAVYDEYAYYAWQPRPGARAAGHGEVFISPLPDGVVAVFVNSGNFAQQTPPGTVRADGIAGALNLGAGHEGSGALAGAAYNNLGMVGAEHLRCLLPFAGIGACSVAVNGVAGSCLSPLRAAFGRPVSGYPARTPCVGLSDDEWTEAAKVMNCA